MIWRHNGRYLLRHRSTAVVADAPESRRLIVHYWLSTMPLGFKCSACGKIFLAKGVTVLPLSEPSEEVKKRFESHRCEEQESLDRQRPA
jgi:hypothetical protein